MDVYFAVRSSHGKPLEVKLFRSEEAARAFAIELSKSEGYTNKAGNTFEHEGHTHEWSWMEDWGDDDGCGVVVGKTESA
jgi:hypothetical protein